MNISSTLPAQVNSQPRSFLRRFLALLQIALCYLFLAAGGVYALQATLDTLVPPTLFQMPYFLAINICVALGTLMLLTVITQNRWIAVSVYLLLLGTLLFVNSVKVHQLDEPFMPTDMLRLTSITFLLRYLSPGSLLFLSLGLLFSLGMIRILSKTFCRGGAFPIRAAHSLFFSLALLTIPILQTFPWDRDTFDPYFEFWDPKGNAIRQGFFASTLQFARYLSVDRPSHYNPAQLGKKLGAFKSSAAVLPPPTESVVILLIESLWDPVNAGVPFKNDPIPNFRQFFQENLSWHVVSNVFGGNTTNTSFEVLTGISTAFIPENANLFQQYLKRKVGGLPWLFRNEGYRTVFLHNNVPTFWSRDQAVPLLGFERFLSSEYMMRDNPTGKVTATDRTIFDTVLDELRSTNEKQFIEADTIATHGPYKYVMEPELAAEFVNPADNAANEDLLVFASKLKKTDTEFGRFREALRTIGKPVRLIVYGDHQPMASLPYVDKTIRKEGYYPKFEVMLGLEKRNEDLASYQYKTQPVSFNCLTPVLARSLGLPADTVLGYIDKLCVKQPVVSRPLIGKQAYPELYDHAVLLYDSIFGNSVVQSYQKLDIDQPKVASVEANKIN